MFDNLRLPRWLGWCAFGAAGVYLLVKVSLVVIWLLKLEGTDRYEPAIGLLDIGLGILMVIAGAGLRRTGEFTWIARILDKRIRSHVTEEHDKTRDLINQNYPTNTLPDILKLASQAVKNAYHALDGASSATRQEAILTLLESDDPKAVDTLELAVKHPTKSVRIEAALALAEKTDCRNDVAMPGLIEALHESDKDIKKRALLSIYGIFREVPSSISQTAIAELIDILGDTDNDIRWDAASLLISQCRKTLPYLIEAISHEFSSVRIAALEAIWIISHNQTLPYQQLLSAVPALIEILNDHRQATTPRDLNYTFVSKLAEEVLIKLSPIEELTAYLQNDRTWMHEQVKRVIKLIQGRETAHNVVDASKITNSVEVKKETGVELLESDEQDQYFSYSLNGSEDFISVEDLLVMVKLIRNMMIDFAENKGYSGSQSWKEEQEHIYTKNRTIILSITNKQVQKLISHLLKTNSTLSSVRSEMQSNFAHYKERREFIQEKFAPLIDFLDIRI